MASIEDHSARMTRNDFLSCDWGTTSFRLRWVCGAEHEVVQEVREQTGIKSLYEEAARSGTKNEADRPAVFAGFLRAKIEELFRNKESPLRAPPLVISGMASSSVGWRELSYAKTPFALDGSGLISRVLDWSGPDWLGTTYLISGVATEFEMMRGEESEIIGLMSGPNVTELRKRCLLILPGTHSKHVWIENESVVDFRTFMTGELFEVLGRQSLLRASVDLAAQAGSDPLSESATAAFREGVSWAKEHGLAGGLFRVRTRAVLDGRPLAENTWFFSGVLIGAELADINSNGKNRPVIVAAARGLSELYGFALELVADNATQWIQLPPEQVERGVIAAHALFLQNRAAASAR
jgi:2-dehydro-3-deoxygalactonokinase